MTKPYRLIILTSDNYIKAVRPYHYFLEKYWPNYPNVLVAGFTEPDFDLPERFSFHSIGEFSDYPVNRWSDSLIKLLHDIEDEVFLFTLEDMWLTRPVYDRVVDMCHDYMMQFEYVARLDLTGDRLHAGGALWYGELGHVDLVFSHPDSQYHLSTMPAFWRKDHLLSALVPGETPWQVELQGTPRLGAMRGNKIVLGTNAWPIKVTLAFRGGNPHSPLLDDISESDIRALHDLGYMKDGVLV